MNRLEGTISASRGEGAILLVTIDGAWGSLHALVVGGARSRWTPGLRVAALFKETAPTLLPPGEGLGIDAIVLERRPGEVLSTLSLGLPGRSTIEAILPVEEIPGGAEPGDRFRLHLPASAVSLEVL